MIIYILYNLGFIKAFQMSRILVTSSWKNYSSNTEIDDGPQESFLTLYHTNPTKLFIISNVIEIFKI
jgi:hypothetical protein